MATRITTTEREEALNAYYEELAALKTAPLWKHLHSALTSEPKTKVVPYLWSWAELQPRVLRSGELVSAAEAERRVIMLLNPGLEGQIATTQTLFAGIQLILPGEVARTHRHTPAALRFIIEGEGAYTTVDGEKTVMRPGDFVLTPNWTWHDHGNESAGPVMWLDGLDIPLVSYLNAVFFELYETEQQPVTKPVDDSIHRYAGSLLPTWERRITPYSPLLNYTWDKTREALAGAAAGDAGSPFDGVMLEYTNPYTGGPALPTMGCQIQLIRAGQRTQAHRHTPSVIYHVAEGSGATIVNGQRFNWTKGDTFVLPTWAWHEHLSVDAADAVLFSFTDAPVLAPLGLIREQAYAERHQVIASEFRGEPGA